MLALRNVSKTYASGVHALRDATLTIPRGVFGLLGPNGAGKSTLMRTIATLQTPDSGQIWFGGVDVLANPQHLRERLGFLPQDFGAYPRETAEGALNYIAQLKGIVDKGERADMVEDLLHKTNLFAARGRRIGELSGGMRQRFGVAQALIGSPELVMVDEPTSGLDPGERLRLLDLLCAVSEHAAVLLSTHIVQDVSDICTRMAVLDRGQVVMHGRPEDALHSMEGRVWQAIVPRGLDMGENIPVISRQLVRGSSLVVACAPSAPDERFSPAKPSLDHFYFEKLAQNHGISSAATENAGNP